jgi:hypothetical protein
MEKGGLLGKARQRTGDGARAGATAANSGDAWPPSLPPWASPTAWRAVTAALDHHLRLPHIRSQGKIRQKAGAIAQLTMRLDLPMEVLARVTCPACEDPCCRRATLWYDFVDLLVIGHACRSWPPGQPMAAVGAGCRYLGQAGCRLPRIQRPWICTWYLCPRQIAQLEAFPPSQRIDVAGMIAGVKQLRKALEAAFIHAAMAAG